MNVRLVKFALLLCLISFGFMGGVLTGGATAQAPVASQPAPHALTDAERLAALEKQVADNTTATAAAQTAGDNAWMLVSAALVLMMSGPGLALFYSGMVRKKNV